MPTYVWQPFVTELSCARSCDRFRHSPGELRDRNLRSFSKKQADVVDAVLEHGDAIDPQAERKRRV